MSDEKLSIIDFDQKKNELIAACERLQRDLPELEKMAKVIAELRMASYKAHLEAGFKPEQALELCKTMSM